MANYTVSEISKIIDGTIIGDDQKIISSPEQIELANSEQITFIGHKKFERLWETSNAGVAIVNIDISIEPGQDRAFIKVPNADIAMAKVLTLFAPAPPIFKTDIHPSASVDETAEIGAGTKIGPGCYVGPNVKIGENVILYPNVTVFDDVTIGNNTIIWSGSVVRERCHVGSHCILHPNSTIGADGFGFTPDPKFGLVKIPQIGNVVLGNYVEVGANSSIDRGKFSSTILGDGCKIDNLVQIGHNSKLGKFCIMAGNSGLAGSVTLGDGVIIGGSASIKDHLTIGDGAIIGAGSGVASNVDAGKTVLGYPAVDARLALKQWALIKRMATE